MASSLASKLVIECQICESKQNLIDIETPRFKHLIAKVETITDSQVEHRNWLRFVCLPCTAKLDHLWKFQNLCKNAYRKFLETFDADLSFQIIEKCENDDKVLASYSETPDMEEEEEKKYFSDQETVFLWEGNPTKHPPLPVGVGPEFCRIKLPLLKEEKMEICDEEEKNLRNISLPGINTRVVNPSYKTEVYTAEISLERSDSPNRVEDICTKLIREGQKRSLEVKRVSLPAPGKENIKKRKTKPIESEPQKCSTCNKEFKQRQHLRNHIKEVHEKILRFMCDVCGKGFKRKAPYRDHLETHSVKRSQFSCAICSKTFTLKSNLLRHIIGIHIDRSRRQKCKSFCRHCKSRFNTREDYLEHVKTHPTVRIHGHQVDRRCSSCSKTFKTSQALEAHERIHTGVKPFVCKICSKEFRQDQHLRTHMNIHTKEKKYPCDFCDKVFTQAGNLKVHRRIHTGEKPYECLNCSERFPEQKMWKRHTAKCSDES